MSDAPWYDLIGSSAPPLSRRRFMELMGASLALTGLGGCGGNPPQYVVPAVTPHPDHALGAVLHYASFHLVDGFAVGVRARCRDGRPLLVTGDPEHPASGGGCGIHAQAELLRLYDPMRPRSCRYAGGPATWRQIRAQLANQREDGGAGLHLLLPPTSSPTAQRLLALLRERYPALHVHALQAPWLGQAEFAYRRIFRRPVLPLPRLEQAQIVAAFDIDPLTQGPWAPRTARGFAAARFRHQLDRRNRVYVAEATPSPLGSSADHRLPTPAHRIVDHLRVLVAELHRIAGREAPTTLAAEGVELDPSARAWLTVLAQDLQRHAGAALVMVGERQPPAAHALVVLANQLIAAPGSTLVHVPDPRQPAAEGNDLRALVTALDAGSVEDLVVFGGNPAYASSGALDLGFALNAATRSWYLGDEVDETAQLCTGFIARHHWLERWDDARALDGTWSLAQPTLRPLADGAGDLAVLAALAGLPAGSDRTLVEATLQAAFELQVGDRDRIVQLGHVPDSAWEAPTLEADRAALDELLASEQPTEASGIHLELRHDYRVLDGRYAGNPWLQELPEPISTLTWGNAALISPRRARALGVTSGDRLRIDAEGVTLEVPALVMPGASDDSVTVSLGYGRNHGLLPAFRVGINAYPALPAQGPPWRRVDLTVGVGSEQLATVQEHWDLHERPVALATALDHLLRHPDFTRQEAGDEVATTRRHEVVDGLQWGMTIDLDTCIGCNACMVACQAENNVPVVGKDLVIRSLEMHWLRVDRYFRGPAEDPTYFINQPMLCQHCERAPCEYVCPTGATTHSDDGINEMTYNRCVGTRFCANNCPYKVRRFNFYEYNDSPPGTRRLAYNPAVTVRARGVMEKCTYCVQRIREQEQDARARDRRFDPETVYTACESACPTAAIGFGNVNDPDSRAMRMRVESLTFKSLGEIGTEPRTRYLLRLRNATDGLA